MQKYIKHILSKILIVVVSMFFVVPSFCADSNLAKGDIGDYGLWNTDLNRQHYVDTLSNDVNQFQAEFQRKIVNDYVPPEAKIGVAFMNGLSYIAKVLDSSLVRFAMLFMIIMYTFWAMFEAYTIIIGQNEASKHWLVIGKKGVMVALWIAILKIGPAETFMMVMSPVLMASTIISDAFLNTVSSVAGASLPDTCAAIRDYAANNIQDSNLLSADRAADIMCVPSRLSGFCYTAASVGWRWVSLGIGRSTFSVLCGLVFVGGFIYVGWRLIFIAFGVIADLFMGVMMLPFTALAETMGGTTYKGRIGNIFNGFMQIFHAEKLNVQISRFVNAALHFIVLSIVIALCAALLSGIVDLNSADAIPHIEEPGFYVSVLILALCLYIANNANKFASEIGGGINTQFGNDLQNAANSLWKKTKSGSKTLWKIIKESRK